jgi:transposase
MERFDVSFNDLLFDPTNFFTYINPKKPNQTIPRHGYSKEGRHTLNLVNFSLFCALDGGIPFLHLIYPGNVNDSSHFKGALKKLEARVKQLGISPSKVTLTFDKGNLSKDAFKVIDEEGFEFIASIRPSAQKDILGTPPEEFSMKTLPNGKKVGVKEFNRKVYGKERRIVAGYNANRAKLAAKNFDAKLDKRLEKIRYFFKDRLNERRWTEQKQVFDKCQRELGSKRFRKAVKIDISGKSGDLSLSVSKDKEQIEKYKHTLGKSFLMTNRADLTPLEVVWSYRQQYIVEHAFKLLKNPAFLSIRPMYAHTDSSVRGHCFICFIGLLLLALLVREIIQHDIPMSLPKIIDLLKEIRITRIHIPGRKEPVEKVDTMSKKARNVYNALNLNQFL